jgi:predicted O-methyltransferase YrrM
MGTKLEYIRNNILKVGCWMRSSEQVRFYLNKALWEGTGYPWTKLSPKPLEELFPGIENLADSIEVAHPFSRLRGTSVELDELIVILSILRFTKAKRVIEIGTFDGNTTLNLALNVGEDGEIVTIDLPPTSDESLKNGNTDLRQPCEFEKRQYVDHPRGDIVRQVYGDSRTMDWSTVGDGFDLAFIDGDHTEPYVRSDTENVLTVIRPGGVVVWHDYERRAVSTVLDKAASRGAPISWVSKTRIAVGTFADPLANIEYFCD